MNPLQEDYTYLAIVSREGDDGDRLIAGKQHGNTGVAVYLLAELIRSLASEIDLTPKTFMKVLNAILEDDSNGTNETSGTSSKENVEGE